MGSRFQGKTVLVTGAGGGLGRSIAEHFLDEGANVVAVDINKQLLADFDEKVTSAHPNRALAVECNITLENDLDRVFQQAEANFGGFDHAVNCAGIMDKFDPAGTLDLDIWNRVIAINLTAPLMVTKRLVNALTKAERGGSIVNVGSIASHRGFSAGAAYTASKHGLLGLTKNTAGFYRSKGIRCNAILPGAMNTNIGHALATGYCEEGMAVVSKLYYEPHNIVALGKAAKLVAFLCSDDAEFINGAAVSIDCGLTAI